jgi:C-terminal processing protease CtpA/Prc
MSRQRLIKSISLLIVVVVCCSTSIAQGGPQQPDKTIDAAMRSEVIEGVLKRLNAGYVFPDVAKKMELAIRDRMQKKEYDQLTSARGFAQKLTADLQEVSRDKHLRVTYSHDPIPEETGRREPSPEERERFLNYLRTVNFGFEKVERLQGNVGYLDLRGFMSADLGAETAVAAMNLLANTDALIVDLRKNGGGDPAMVALISSYLFGGPVHLNDLYWREGDSTHQWWTLPFVPGKRFGPKNPVYVLTSKRTFSAAEEFTYNLQNLKRATIVGETTGGGAHPGGGRRVNAHFGVWVPSGRAINPISKTNWEGTGVKPDIDVPADHALKVAHIEALNKVLEKITDAERQRAIKELIETTQKELDDLKAGKPKP